MEASADVSKFFLQYGLPFWGHDKSESSTNQAFLIRLHGDKNSNVRKVILENSPQNKILTSPVIQKNIANAWAKEILKAIIGDLNGDYFSILVDKSKDFLQKEQISLVLHFINKNSDVVK